jgi:hypothetical protein
MDKRLRLLGVIAQFRLAADDGETLEEITVQPVAISPKDWPRYATEVWPGAFAEMQAQFSAQNAAPDPGHPEQAPGSPG